MVEAMSMVGLGYRMARYTRKQREKHRFVGNMILYNLFRIPFMDPFAEQFEGLLAPVYDLKCYKRP